MKAENTFITKKTEESEKERKQSPDAWYHACGVLLCKKVNLQNSTGKQTDRQSTKRIELHFKTKDFTGSEKN